MHCLRCGKENRNEQVFCDACLKTMEQRPVKPGTTVQIPEKPVYTPERRSVLHHAVSPAEQISQLRGTLRWMTVTIVVLSVVLMLTAGMLIYTLTHSSAQETPGNLGRNYTSENTDRR